MKRTDHKTRQSADKFDLLCEKTLISEIYR